MLRRAVATRGRVLLVAVCLAAPLACKSSDSPPSEPPLSSDAGEPGNEPGAGGTDTSGGGTSNGGGTTGVVGGEPGVGSGGAPTEPGSWDEATWDEALWQ